jgi:23S rRNA pseudouridine1911/1915/1917 synthase
VTVNGRSPKASTKLRAGDRVEVYVPPPPPTEIVPEDIPLEVLYEDGHLIVLNKRPDIIVHPARTDKSGTMINALAYHFRHRSGGALSGVGKEFARPGVVHRLDRHTSGLIVFAKTDEAHWKIGRQFENRTVDKRYLAVVHGVYEPPVDPIDLPLGPHPSREKGYREKYVVRHDHLGKQAMTIARVRRTYLPGRDGPHDGGAGAPIEPSAEAAGALRGGIPASSPGWKPPTVAAPEAPARAAPRGTGPTDVARGFSLVELELKTGRTHQIRVHLSHRGYPIAGDDMYGGRTLYAGAKSPVTTDERDAERGPDGSPMVLVDRQALHAATLRFRHPIDGREMAFAAPLPEDMALTLAALGRLDPRSAVITPPGATVPLA